MKKNFVVFNVLLGILLVLCMGFALPAHADPIEAVVDGAQITVTYIEPVTNEDGSSLTDLNHTNIYYDLGEGTVDAIGNITATGAQGGGTIVESIIVPVNDGQEVDVNIWATATDNSGNESIPSNIITRRIDKLAPGAPQ